MKKAKLKKLYFLMVLVLISSFNLFSKDCQPTPPNPELVINGNFELGLYGFRTTYDTMYIKFPKNIKITTNPYNEYYTFDSCADPVTPNGKFLIVNGNDIFDGLQIVWEQEFDIEPHTYYEFKFMYANIDAKVDTNKNLPIIQVSFNDQFFDTVYVPKTTCLWQTRSFVWYSGENRHVVINFKDLQLKYFGNDFALDEISFKSLCSVQACAGQNQEICFGDTVVLGELANKSAIQGFKPYSYRWYPEEGLNSPFVPNPLAFPTKTTTYYLEVTDSLGCVAFDSVTVIVHSKPLATITTDKPMPICPCDSVKLSATEGLKYFWSTGDTTSSIVVKSPGIYSLIVKTDFGCMDTSSIRVDFYNISTTLKIDTIDAKIGETITLPLKMIDQQNHFVCNYDSFKVHITYNPSVLFPLNHKPIQRTNGTEEIFISGRTLTTLLDSLRFFVTLGNSDYSDINLNSFQWNCNEVKVQTLNGRVNVTNICREGGNRLVDFETQLFLSELPTPVSSEVTILFSTIEKGFTVLKIINSLGEVVDIPFSKISDPGKYYVELNAKNYPNGTYFIILQTPTQTILRQFLVFH
jgi:hypothetical protein